MKKTIYLFMSIICFMHAYASSNSNHIKELERISLIIPPDDLTVEVEIPTPLNVKNKFNLTDCQLRQSLEELAKKYSVTETNKQNQLVRISAVCWLGEYGATNNLPYLKTIMTNKNDYAQMAAMESSIYLLKAKQELVPLVRNIVTNQVHYPLEFKTRAYVILHCISVPNMSPMYVSDTNAQARIAAFFLERAAVEEENTMYVDRVACELNPSYRHSQQRRDNLARLRPPGLTGEQADIYNFRERDALPKEAK